MTRYSQEDLEKWEYKILRSATSQFKKPEVFQQVLGEEALAGWELLEKLDDSRIRFKRPVEARKRDISLPPEYDPYRTQYGISEGALGFRIMLAVFLCIGILISVIILAKSGALPF